MDETKITANLPTLDMVIVRRGHLDENGETITVNVRASPSMEAFGKSLAWGLMAPAMMWAAPMTVCARLAGAFWKPWLGALALQNGRGDEQMGTYRRLS